MSADSIKPGKIIGKVINAATLAYSVSQAAASAAAAESAAKASELAAKAAEAASTIDVGEMIGSATETVVDIISEIV